MDDSQSITEREQKLIRLLIRRGGEWVTQAEIGAEVGLTRAQPRRIAERLIARGEPIEIEQIVSRPRIRINVAKHQIPLRLNLHESAATFLATRLLARYSDKPNPHVVESLFQLGSALQRNPFTQPIGRHIVRTSESLRTNAETQATQDYVARLEKLTEAWAFGHKVSLDYAPLRGKPLLSHKFCPYFLEPSAVGYSTYAIGLDETLGKLRARKIERITGITRLPMEPFEIPEDFDPAKLLGSAWGIWFGDEDPQEMVRLRFMGEDVVKRVKESRWHPSQSIESETKEELIWQASVDAPQEMLPWLRGWGSNVFVIQPEWLRNDVAEHARAQTRMYGVSDAPAASSYPAHRWLWAKADAAGKAHRLSYHMLDVGYCALALWRCGLGAQLKKRICCWLGLNEDDAGRLIAFWASLHDLGKASPAFQDHPSLRQKKKPLYERLKAEMEQAGLRFPNRALEDKHARHEIISTWALRKNGEGLLAKDGALPEALAELIAQMLGGHHGSFPIPNFFAPTHLQFADKQGFVAQIYFLPKTS